MKTQWISCDYRLPKDGRTYLCCLDKKDILGNHVGYEIHTGHIFKDESWIVGGKFDWDAGKVTHWAEPPELPLPFRS